MEVEKILENIAEKYEEILGDNLVGIYLHASLAMGCYTDNSDIDFLVVVNKSLDFETKRELIDSIIHLDSLPKKGLEMSIILKKYAKEFIYPTPFELHYSDYHRDNYLTNHNYICGGIEDKDLAAHMTVIIHRGICLYGKEIKEVFSNIPRRYYIDSIRTDIEEATNEIIENPIYITLNLCRVLYYLKESSICSKFEGGEWGLKIIPIQYKKIVHDALKVYIGDLNEMKYREDELIKYANYMLEEINKYK